MEKLSDDELDIHSKKSITPKKKRSIRNELSKPEKKRAVHQQLFRSEWLQLNEFKNWLQSDPKDATKCRCVACNVSLRCGKSELDKHSMGIKHQSNLKSLRGTLSLTSMVRTIDEKSEKLNNEVNNVKSAEIKLSTFFANHNVPFQTVDSLVPLLKEIFHDSNIAKNIQLHRKKCTNIVKHIIAPLEIEDTVKIIQKHPFSVLVDESTDISTHKFLCVLVRFVHPDDGSIHTKLLELVAVDAQDCSAAKIYGEFKQCMVSKQIPISNIIGIACDGANVMIGKYNSFVSHLKADAPNLIVLQCICHSGALIANKATKQLPRSPEDLIRSVYLYVSGSAKRTSILHDIQEYFHEQKKKILKLADTRWLALHQCVVRLLECWSSLIKYFQLAVVEDHLKSAENILDNLNNSIVKGYFLFLKYSLEYFNSFNAMFQTRKIIIHEMYGHSICLLKTLCQNFLKPKLLTDDLFLIAFDDPTNLLPLDEIYVGADCEELLKTIPNKLANEFKNKCLLFYIKAAKEMVLRLPLKNNLFKEFIFLDPNCALNTENRNIPGNLTLLLSTFDNYIDSTKIMDEWRSLPYFFNQQQIEHLKTLSIQNMWHEISNAKDFVIDCFKFANLSKLAKLVQALPHSNSEAERIFSIVTDVKTKKRNKLNDDTLNSIAVIRSSFQDKNSSCVDFKVTKAHLNLHNYNNLYK